MANLEPKHKSNSSWSNGVDAGLSGADVIPLGDGFFSLLETPLGGIVFVALLLCGLFALIITLILKPLRNPNGV